MGEVDQPVTTSVGEACGNCEAAAAERGEKGAINALEGMRLVIWLTG